MLHTDIGEIRGAIAEDLRVFAVLHDRELDAEMLERLRCAPFESWLGLQLTSTESGAALGFLNETLRALPETTDTELLDRLAVEFARIYLTHQYGASPNESVWLTEENIIRQEPMFEVRAFYKRYGVEVENWRERSDDHLVIQLMFLAHLIGNVSDGEPLNDAARFLDRHLLIWIKDFASGVAGRAEQRLYPGLALVTACYLDELRDHLTDLTGEARRDAEFREAAHRRLRDVPEDADPEIHAVGN